MTNYFKLLLLGIMCADQANAGQTSYTARQIMGVRSKRYIYLTTNAIE